VIPRQELLDLATDFGLQANVVEKDYALGWLLAGIGQHGATRDTWIFKGGTCLKKCFFETYRFSEDLDFTLLDATHLDERFLSSLFEEIGEWVYEQTGLLLPPEARKFEVFTNPRGGTSAEGRVGYRGPLGRAGDAPRVKLDLTDHERLVLPVDRREVHHPYSDRPAEGIRVSSYCFEEVFAEKVRALAERLRPRDLYDVVHLYRRKELHPDRLRLMQALQEKCAFKEIPVPTIESLRASPLVGELQVSWEQMLGHQLPELPPFDIFWNELPEVFDWLFRSFEKPALGAAPAIEAIDAAWHIPAMASSWRGIGVSAPMEVIRFAAANRLCVELDYRKESGERTRTVIEPYSLRKTMQGNLVLYGVKADTGENRSYRVDRIQGAAATRRTFQPRYLVELSETGFMGVVPTTVRSSTASAFGSPKTIPRRPPSGRPSKANGPTYIFKCSVCGKTFRRSSYDGTLNEHKNKNGQPCYGRFGTHVKTEY
jgi:predicted nucleotidyltransferase component of viral defense system